MNNEEFLIMAEKTAHDAGTEPAVLRVLIFKLIGFIRGLRDHHERELQEFRGNRP